MYGANGCLSFPMLPKTSDTCTKAPCIENVTTRMNNVCSRSPSDLGSPKVRNTDEVQFFFNPDVAHDVNLLAARERNRHFTPEAIAIVGNVLQ